MLTYQTAEFALAGCVLIDERSLPLIREVLPSSAVFANAGCKAVYEAACRLADRGKPVDPVVLGVETGLDNNFLMECMDTAVTCSSAPEYARAVLEGFERRQLLEMGQWLQDEAFSPGTGSRDLVTAVRTRLDDLTKNTASNDVLSPSDSLHQFLAFRGEVNEGKRKLIKTGFPSVDNFLGGLAQGGLYIIAARPGVGKSAFGVAVADMIARNRKCLYVSLEMTADELNARRIAAFSTSPCSFGKLLFGTTTEEEDLSVINACAELSQRNLYIVASPYMTVSDLGMKIREAEAEVVVVDYLGLLTGSDKKASEYDKITQISGDLKRLAKQRGCVIIALCQLNRESANTPQNGDNRPKLSQLRSSGAIEQDADGVMLLHRPEYGKPDTQRASTAPQQFFVDIAKNRHGRTGTAELAWYAPVNRFEDRGGRWPVKSWT